MAKEQLPEHSEWQHRLFYIIAVLITYQMTTYTITNLACTYRFIWENKLITNDEICKATSEDTKSAIADYLTLVLALIAKVPDGTFSKPVFRNRKNKEPEVMSTLDKGAQE